VIQAKDKAVMIDTVMNQLLKDEEKAKALRPKVIGAWTRTANAEGEGATAVEKKKMVLKADGTLELDEQLKGKMTEVRKEDWQFLSSGEWAMKGDSLLLFVKHEKCLRQNFWNFQEKDGKEQWVEWNGPTYDTTITTGVKDRFMTYERLTADFDKKK
jgi:hypothetical protein